MQVIHKQRDVTSSNLLVLSVNYEYSNTLAVAGFWIASFLAMTMEVNNR